MNLNNLAKEITLSEGKAQSLSIAQVKEVMSILLTKLAIAPVNEVNAVLKRYCKPSNAKPKARTRRAK